MYLFTPKEDILKHKVLGLLVAEKVGAAGKKSPVDCIEISLHVNQLADALKTTPEKVRAVAATLCTAEEAQYCKTTNDRGLLCVHKNAFVSYSERKYLKQGRAYGISVIKDYLYIIVSAIAIISTISGLILYTVSIKNTQREVNQLRQEVQEMRRQLHPTPIQKK